eukprot:COSAG02_NODE_69985_length_197_cov_111.081633_1_plen_51_part_01
MTHYSCLHAVNVDLTHICLVKLNASAGLSGRETMCLFPVVQACSIVELAAQ